MDDLCFLKDVTADGNATLSARYIDGSVAHINNLNLEIMQEASPLLGFAFEETRSGPKYCLENVTQASLACLLRYIYSDNQDYVPETCKEQTISMLLTVRVYFLADIYDIDGLRTLAKGNLTQECEFSCSNPSPPMDLCDAIRFVYESLPNHAEIIDTLANYCVSMFLYHKLGEDSAFRSLAYEHRRFQQDLCMVNIRRGFVDDAALAIIQLPIKPFDRVQESAFERVILQDVLYEMWSVLDENDDKLNVSTKHSDFKLEVRSSNPVLLKQLAIRAKKGAAITNPGSKELMSALGPARYETKFWPPRADGAAPTDYLDRDSSNAGRKPVLMPVPYGGGRNVSPSREYQFDLALRKTLQGEGKLSENGTPDWRIGSSGPAQESHLSQRPFDAQSTAKTDWSNWPLHDFHPSQSSTDNNSNLLDKNSTNDLDSNSGRQTDWEAFPNVPTSPPITALPPLPSLPPLPALYSQDFSYTKDNNNYHYRSACDSRNKPVLFGAPKDLARQVSFALANSGTLPTVCSSSSFLYSPLAEKRRMGLKFSNAEVEVRGRKRSGSGSGLCGRGGFEPMDGKSVDFADNAPSSSGPSSSAAPAPAPASAPTVFSIAAHPDHIVTTSSDNSGTASASTAVPGRGNDAGGLLDMLTTAGVRQVNTEMDGDDRSVEQDMQLDHHAVDADMARQQHLSDDEDEGVGMDMDTDMDMVPLVEEENALVQIADTAAGGADADADGTSRNELDDLIEEALVEVMGEGYMQQHHHQRGPEQEYEDDYGNKDGIETACEGVVQNGNPDYCYGDDRGGFESKGTEKGKGKERARSSSEGEGSEIDGFVHVRAESSSSSSSSSPKLKEGEEKEEDWAII